MKGWNKFMKKKAIEFLKDICQHDGNACVNYKIYEYGNLIESLPFSKAVEKFMTDFEEMKIFAEAYNLDENRAFEMTCSIWKKHIVVF